MESPSNRKKAIEELIRGKEIAERVESQLREDAETDALLKEVVASIAKALSLLDCSSDEKNSYEIFGGKRKISILGDKRGASRKRVPASPCRQVISKTEKDEYIWRKYGEKEIHNMIYRRSYYRCVHKIDRGCQATKQIQKYEKDPSLFLLIYQGEHTCKRNPQLLIPNSSLKEQSLISFQSNASNLISEDTSPLSSSFPSEDVLRNLIQCSPNSDNNVLLPNMDGIAENSQLGFQRMDSVSDFGDFSHLTIGSVSDHLDFAPGLQSSISSLDDLSILNMDYFDNLDETFLRDNDEVFSFDDAELVDNLANMPHPFN